MLTYYVLGVYSSSKQLPCLSTWFGIQGIKQNGSMAKHSIFSATGDKHQDRYSRTVQ